MFQPHDRIRAISLTELEETIAQALTTKLGLDMSVSISQIDFSSLHGVKADITFSAKDPF